MGDAPQTPDLRPYDIAERLVTAAEALLDAGLPNTGDAVLVLGQMLGEASPGTLRILHEALGVPPALPVFPREVFVLTYADEENGGRRIRAIGFTVDAVEQVLLDDVYNAAAHTAPAVGSYQLLTEAEVRAHRKAGA